MANYIKKTLQRKAMKVRALLLLAVLLFSLPFALAEITVNLPQDYFNVGDTLEVSASAVSDSSMTGFLRFTAVCGPFVLPYYLIPIEIQAGFRSQVNTPPLPILASMKGQCAIKVELLNEASESIDSALSQSFGVSDGLGIILLTENLTALPGTTKKIEGLVRGALDRSVNADIEFFLDNESYTTSTFNGKFALLLGISPVSKSGTHSIRIVATDEKQNKGSFSGEILVFAVPSRIEAGVLEDVQDPGKNISYGATVTDQAGDRIADLSEIRIKGEDGAYLFKGVLESGSVGTYILGQYLSPGEYILEAQYQNLATEDSFAVNAIKDIRVSQSGEIVYVENVGNVPYKEEAVLIIEGGKTNHMIRKKLDLKPGQVASIELGKELPSGRYNVVLPQGMNLWENGNSSILGRTLLGQDIEVHDNRSSIKKIGEGLASATGSMIGADGILTKNPWVGPIILFSIVGLIALYYTRWFWSPFVFRRR